MKEFIDKNNLMYSSQYGFCKSHSTEHVILDIVEAILSNMDKPNFSCDVFIDLKRHPIRSIMKIILLDKLNYYGFRELINDWFQSHLKNRMQTIQIREYLSTKLISPCGVSQGPVIGPLLFFFSLNI